MLLDYDMQTQLPNINIYCGTITKSSHYHTTKLYIKLIFKPLQFKFLKIRR